jgi:hypothetical protein
MARILRSNTSTAKSVDAAGNNGGDSNSVVDEAHASVDKDATEKGDEGKKAGKNSVGTAEDGAKASVDKDATEKGDEGKKAGKNSVGTAEDGAKHACDQTRNDSSSSSNKNQAVLAGEQGTDNNSSLIRSARVHCSTLALLSYHRFGKFWYLDVNANNVSLEKTGPIQNTLAGNPTKIDTANAESIDSSVVAAILTNKPDESCVKVTDVSKYVPVFISAPGADKIDETETMVKLNLPLGRICFVIDNTIVSVTNPLCATICS